MNLQVAVSCVPADLPDASPIPDPKTASDGPQRYQDAAAAYGVLKTRNALLESVIAECKKAAK